MLLSNLGIPLQQKRILSYFDHSDQKVENHLISLIKEEDQDVYLVSEAGSPLISDPAYPLVVRALAEGIEVQTVPGVSSFLVALELSGLPPYPFHFYGFFPKEKEKIQSTLERIEALQGTHIFFESPHRIASSLQAIAQQAPLAQVAVARELTKKFETLYRFKAREWESVKDKMVVKGEFVLLLNFDHKGGSADEGEEGRGRIAEWDRKEILRLAEELMKSGAKKKTLAKLLAEILGINSKEVYASLEMK